MDMISLGESEYRFANLIWEHAPVSSGALVALAQERLGWKKSTTYTVLKKLCGKGLFQNVDATVTVLVPREQVQRQESRQFVERAFGGSLPGFVAAFLDGGVLSRQEADELKALIDQARKE